MSNLPQLLPEHTAEDYDALKADIKERGQRTPIVMDQDGQIIDGHTRAKILTELGVPRVAWVTEPRSYADDTERRLDAIKLNILRRHLTREQKRDLIAAYLAVNPDMSDRAIGSELDADHKTVAAVRQAKEATGEIPQSPTRKSKDKKIRKVNGTGKYPKPNIEDDGCAKSIEEWKERYETILREGAAWISGSDADEQWAAKLFSDYIVDVAIITDD